MDRGIADTDPRSITDRGINQHKAAHLHDSEKKHNQAERHECKLD
jgi:hypothetical protein